MADKILFRTGNEVDAGVLDAREPGFTADTLRQVIGIGGGEYKLLSSEKLVEVDTVAPAAIAEQNDTHQSIICDTNAAAGDIKLDITNGAAFSPSFVIVHATGSTVTRRVVVEYRRGMYVTVYVGTSMLFTWNGIAWTIAAGNEGDIESGLIIGGGLRYVSSDSLRLRPIKYHFKDSAGINHLVKILTEKTIDMSGVGTGNWKYIVGDMSGNIAIQNATGAATTRPTDSFFQWGEYGGTGFDHNKQGYYYSATQRILGVIHKVSSTSFYIISLHKGADETGENINGCWTRIGDIQETWHDLSIGTIASWGALYTTFTWTYPVTFIEVPKRSIAGGLSQAGDTTTARILFSARRSISDGVGSSQFGARDVTGGAHNSTAVYVSVFAKGKWK